jgi:hypothetical protein
MTTLTVCLPDDQHERLKTLAAQRGLSFNKLFEEFSTKAIAAFDAENRRFARARELGMAELVETNRAQLDNTFDPSSMATTLFAFLQAAKTVVWELSVALIRSFGSCR